MSEIKKLLWKWYAKFIWFITGQHSQAQKALKLTQLKKEEELKKQVVLIDKAFKVQVEVTKRVKDLPDDEKAYEDWRNLQ